MTAVPHCAGASERLVALDAATGDLRWARRQKGEIASSPAIADGRVLISSMDGALTAWSARRRASG